MSESVNQHTAADKRIGLIAGSGRFPLIFAQKASQRGYRVYAVGYHDETDLELANHVAEVETLYLGQIKRLLKFFKKHGISEAVMAGAVSKVGAITKIRPDIKAISLIAGMRKDTHDDRILRAFAGMLEKEGIQVCASTFLLPELLAPAGIWTRRKPSRDEIPDMMLGFTVARAIGNLDIGQCVVVGNGTVLAVEAIDGTDSTIRRGGRLSKKGAVAAKVCKPIQDFRFDVPAVGAQTIRIMHEAGVNALVLEAERSMVFDREEMIALADQWGISIAAVKDAADLENQ
jgi:UDP-2,3-diacylglucosamine hydrolase